MLILAIAVYAAAMIAANLILAAAPPQFRVWVIGFNAFVLIGMDLALRDWLHIRMRPWHLGALIAATGLLTYLLNPAAQNIAIASAVAFAVAALADWLVFFWMPGSWLQRSASSNVAGAAVDSLLFPLIAFGSLSVAPLMLLCKVAGGTLWAWLLSRKAAA
jgi:hypothetical protein